jgi:hypothetical protein
VANEFTNRLLNMAQSLSDSLSSGPRATVEDVCRSFYDRQLLTTGDDGDRRQQFFESLEESMIDADEVFSFSVEEEDFQIEVTALRLELFGLAFTQRVGWRREDLCLRELTTTLRYLKERDELRIWASMGAYNQAIADGDLWLNPMRLQRGRRLQRLAFNDKWQEGGPQESGLLRYINRKDAVAAWQHGIAATQMMKTFSRRMDFRPNAQGQMRLHALLHVFYDEALQGLRGVRIV